MLHLAVDADQGALAIGNRWPVEQLDQLGHNPFAKCGARFKELPQISDPTAGERIADNRHPDRTHDRPRRRPPEL